MHHMRYTSPALARSHVTRYTARVLRNKFYVYVWTNTRNGKQYVGKGSGSRAFQHVLDAWWGRGMRLSEAMREEGAENFQLSFVATDLTENESYALEQVKIHEWRTAEPNGYNIAVSCGRKPDPAEEAIRIDALQRAPGLTREQLRAYVDFKMGRAFEIVAMLVAMTRLYGLDPERATQIVAERHGPAIAAKVARAFRVPQHD